MMTDTPVSIKTFTNSSSPGDMRSDTAGRLAPSPLLPPPPPPPPSQAWDWATDAHNPYNWPSWKKNLLLISVSVLAFNCSLGTAIISPAHDQLVSEFRVSSTAAFLPISTYLIALGLGPVLGGPLSETAGRQAVWLLTVVGGGLSSLVCGFAPTFAGVCALRFLAGFFNGPSVAVGPGALAEVFTPAERGFPDSLWMLGSMLGTSLGPLFGVLLTREGGWRWTQFTLCLLSATSLLLVVLAGETYHPTLQHRRMRELGLVPPEKTPVLDAVRKFLTISLVRPVHMMFTEPIVGLLTLYIACMFAITFSFYTTFFWIFGTVYAFTPEDSGYVFLGLALGTVLGIVVNQLCDGLLYQRQQSRYPVHQIPPEHRLYSAMISSVLFPISLFMFATATRADRGPAAPVVAVVIYGIAFTGLVVGCMGYLSDVYHRTTIASASSATSLGRYVLGSIFPLFALRMYQALGISAASCILGGVALVMLPLPWTFYFFGEKVRAKSKYQTASY
ncbi:major facilitator superfamily domain-containing protein [Xylariomycetidae sp. FL2044]|nr:major facilitator superfamily domain-containing protein [Xylariomycetidae sp. FL2044]